MISKKTKFILFCHSRVWISTVCGVVLGLTDCCFNSQFIAVVGTIYSDPVDLSSAYALHSFLLSLGKLNLLNLHSNLNRRLDRVSSVESLSETLWSNGTNFIQSDYRIHWIYLSPTTRFGNCVLLLEFRFNTLRPRGDHVGLHSALCSLVLFGQQSAVRTVRLNQIRFSQPTKALKGHKKDTLLQSIRSLIPSNSLKDTEKFSLRNGIKLTLLTVLP